MKYFSEFYSKVNQIVYSSLPIYSSSFKVLAPTVFEIFCWQGKNVQKLQRAITHEAFFRIYSKVNQVIYSSLQIHSTSFKALALTVFEIFCWQGKNALNNKGPPLKKYFSKFYSKVNQVIYSSLPVYSSSFKALASIVFEIFCWQDCIHIFSKDHNSGKGHNPVKKKICVSYFFMRNPYKKFQNSSMYGSKVILCIKKRDKRTNRQTDERTDECPRSNMPLQLLRSWGHKN